MKWRNQPHDMGIRLTNVTFCSLFLRLPAVVGVKSGAYNPDTNYEIICYMINGDGDVTDGTWRVYVAKPA